MASGVVAVTGPRLGPGREAFVANVLGCAAPGRAGVVVVADGGCGATTVLRAVAARLRAAGRSVGEVAAAPHDRATPGAAFAAAGPGPGSIAGPIGGDGEVPTAATLAATVAVEAMVAGVDAVVVVDDAQWLDETSAALLGAVAAEGRASLVVGVRADARLPASLAPLVRDPAVARLALGPLDGAEVAHLLEAAWGAPVTDAVADRARAACDGRPGPLADLTARWPGAGAVAPARGVWDLVRGVDPPLPSGDHALPGPGPERTAMSLVALTGAPPAAAVERVVGLAVLDDLERSGVVEVSDGARLRLARPSLGLAMAGALDPEERRAALAALLGALGADDEVDPVDRATWAVAAGVPLPARATVEAARLALDRGDAARADLLAGAVVAAAEAGPSVVGDDPHLGAADGEVAVEAEVVGALALWRQGRVDEALARLDALAAVGRDGGGSAAARFEVLRARLLVRAHATDDVDGALRDAEDALAAADAATARELGPMVAYLTLMAGWPARADATARTWLDTAPPDDARRDQAEVVRVFAAFQAGQRRPAPPPSARADDAVMRWRRGIELGHALTDLHRGHVAAAADAADALGRAAHDDGDVMFVGWASVVSGMARLQAGEVRRAQAEWMRAWRAFVPLGIGSRLRPVRGGLRLVEAIGADGVRDLAELGWFDAVPDGPGMLLAGEQASDEVLLDLLRALGPGRASSSAVGRDRARRAGPGAARLVEVADRAEAVAASLDPRGMAASAAATRHLGSLAAPDRAALVTALAEAADLLGTDRARAWAADADARHRGDEAGHLVAVDALLGLGDALSAYLSLRSVASSRGRDERLRAVAAATDLPLPASLAAPATERLTPRELDVARRVAAGAPTKEVAAALGISPRTVDATLAKVYRKLGVRRRADLAALLG